MIDKLDIVESNLKIMFYNYQEYERITNEINLIHNQMAGLKSPNLTDIHSTPEDRQHKLIRLGAKITPLEIVKKNHYIIYLDIYNKYHLSELHEYDYTFLTLLYKDKLTYEKIVEKMAYTDISYVSRKKKAFRR